MITTTITTTITTITTTITTITTIITTTTMNLFKIKITMKIKKKMLFLLFQ